MQTLCNVVVVLSLFAFAFAFAATTTTTPPTTNETPIPTSTIAAALSPSSFDTLAARQQQQRDNFLIGIATIGWQSEGNRSACGKELEVLLKAVDTQERWILKVLDSFGRASPSFGWGNYFWFGEQHLCEDLNEPYSISLLHRQPGEFWFNITSPMALRFVMLYANFTTPYHVDLAFAFEQTLHIGLCMPRSCALTALQQYTLEYFQRGTFKAQRDFDIKIPEIVEVRVPHFSWRYFSQAGSVAFIAIIAVLLILVVLAEALHRRRTNEITHKIELTKTHVLKPGTVLNAIEHVAVVGPRAKWTRFIECFRLTENLSRALSVEGAQSQGAFLSAIAGMRTIVCLWVTVFHVYYYSLFAMANSTMIYAKLEAFLLQPVIQACYYVDVFFVISAFLLVHHFLAHERQMQQIRDNNWLQNVGLYVRMAARRYMRLTPVMLVTLLLNDRVHDLLNLWSPFRLDAEGASKRNWWAHLLYVNNFVEFRQMSCSWMWYVACEMQYFLLFTLLLFVYARNERCGRYAYVTVALLGVVTSWLCYYQRRQTFQIDAIYTTLDALYVKPWTRINPYVGGAAFGWLLHRAQAKVKTDTQTQTPVPGAQTEQQQQQPTQLHSPDTPDVWNVGRAAFWSVCALVYVYTNFMCYWRTTPLWLVASIMSVGKLLFAACVGGVIYECANGRGGYVQSLFGHRVFLFGNKFCYSVYMVAPVVVVGAYALRGTATQFTEVGSGIEFLGIVVLSCVSALLMFVMIELPWQRAVNVLLPASAKRPATRGNDANNAKV